MKLTRWQLLTREGWSRIVIEVPPAMRAKFEDEYQHFRRDNPGSSVTLGSFCRTCLCAFFRLAKTEDPPAPAAARPSAPHDRETCNCVACDEWRARSHGLEDTQH